MNPELEAIKAAWNRTSEQKDDAAHKRGELMFALAVADGSFDKARANEDQNGVIKRYKGKTVEQLQAAIAECNAEIADARLHDDDARELADAYVAAHPEEFTALEGASIEDLVRHVDVFRAGGSDFEESLWRIETYLLHRFAPQNIGGVAHAIIRIPGRGN